MRPEEVYLTDIVDAADAVARFLDHVEQGDFLVGELRQRADGESSTRRQLYVDARG